MHALLKTDLKINNVRIQKQKEGKFYNFLGISRNFDYKNQINLFYWNNQNFVKFMVGETVQIIHRTISR